MQSRHDENKKLDSIRRDVLSITNGESRLPNVKEMLNLGKSVLISNIYSLGDFSTVAKTLGFSFDENNIPDDNDYDLVKSKKPYNKINIVTIQEIADNLGVEKTQVQNLLNLNGIRDKVPRLVRGGRKTIYTKECIPVIRDLMEYHFPNIISTQCEIPDGEIEDKSNVVISKEEINKDIVSSDSDIDMDKETKDYNIQSDDFIDLVDLVGSIDIKLAGIDVKIDNMKKHFIETVESISTRLSFLENQIESLNTTNEKSNRQKRVVYIPVYAEDV